MNIDIWNIKILEDYIIIKKKDIFRDYDITKNYTKHWIPAKLMYMCVLYITCMRVYNILA